MRKRMSALAAAAAAALLLAACGPGDAGGGAAGDSQAAQNAGDGTDTQAWDAGQMPTEDLVPEPVEPTEAEFGTGEPYGNLDRYVEVLGLKEYESLGEGELADEPSEGNVFLVLFLNVENRTGEEDYVNPYYVSASIDGREVEHTFLVNSPEGYETAFTHVPAEGSVDGFIVWEVPADWSSMELDFDNWKDTDHVLLHAAFTRESLSDPPPASER